MFGRLNKSAIWHLCQCINNWLWNSSKWPFTGAVVQSAFLSNRPARTPLLVGGPGYAVGRSVGGIKFLTLFRCAGSLGRRAFQAVLTHFTTSTKYTCGLSTSAANSRDFMVPLLHQTSIINMDNRQQPTMSRFSNVTHAGLVEHQLHWISLLTQVGTRTSYELHNGGGLFMSDAKAISFLVLGSDL